MKIIKYWVVFVAVLPIILLIDPIIIRIFFCFIGITFVPYLILWVAVPSSSSCKLVRRENACLEIQIQK